MTLQAISQVYLTENTSLAQYWYILIIIVILFSKSFVLLWLKVLDANFQMHMANQNSFKDVANNQETPEIKGVLAT